MSSYTGGKWTDKKLRALQRYLNAYMTLMQGKPTPERPFKKIYFDAFCGSGTRISKETPLFGGSDLQEFSEFSPRVALSTEPVFDEYVFCDVKKSHVAQLETRLKAYEFDLRSCRFLVGRADQLILDFCRSTSWKSSRAVMFLDPYGLQVGWKTLEIIAETQAIDLWYLFPSGLGPVRMTPKSGSVPENWAARLTEIWGDEGWRDVAYSEDVTGDLFNRPNLKVLKTGDVASFEHAFMKKLSGIFPGVSRSALRLRNSTGFDMFSLIFACANPNPSAHGPALRIANHVVEMVD